MSDLVVLNTAHQHTFLVSSGSNQGLLLYKASIFTAWPKSVKLGNSIYEFEGAAIVPVDLQTRYAGAANYVRKLKCGFDEAWVGNCDEPTAPNSACCEKHKEKTCCICEKQAVRTCPATMGLVCGSPLCDSDMCNLKHDLGHIRPSPDTREHLESTFASRILGAGLTEDQFEEVLGFFISNGEKYLAALVKLDKCQDLVIQESQSQEYFKEYTRALRECFKQNKGWERESAN